MEHSETLPSSNKEALYAEWEQWKENEPPGERRAEAVSRMRECYEENAKNLDLSSMALSQLPTLPDCVQYLVVDNNQLTQLPALPGSLKELSIRYNQLTQLPALPDSLEKLSANNNQLTQLAALPGSLKELSVRDNQLNRLPTLPSSLEGLFASNNQLTQLPTLPDSLKKLYVYGNRLTELLGLPRSLEELYARDNQLTQLPALPSSLEKLSVSDNPLTDLPALPSSLKKLLANNNQLTQLPELPGSLEELQAHYNQLTQLPVLPGSLKTLSVHNNELTYLPTLPSFLNRLLVANNCLTQLPPTIMALPSNCTVVLDNNPLSERTRQDLQLVTHARQGPRFYFSMSESTPQAPAQSIEEIIAEWYPPEQRAEMEQRWQGIAKEEGAEPFLGFLSRLAHTVNSQHTPFRQFVSDWLSLLSTEPRLRQHSFLIAQGATERCEDRVSLVFNEMQKARVTHEVENGFYDSQLPLLVSRAREMFRLECLERLAREKVKTLRFVDEIEVYLAYQVELREPLQLSSAVKKMRFLGAADVTPDDLEIALLTVKHRENSEFTAWLSRWSPWETVLERLYNSPYQSAIAQLHDEDAFTSRVTATLQQLNLEDNDDARREAGVEVMAQRSDEIKIPLTRAFLQQHQLSGLLDKVWKDEQRLALGSDSPALHREAVNSWKIQDVNPKGSEESSRFAAQLVLQLEDNPTVRKAAAKLAGKYPGHSVLVQLDAEGRYRVVYGDPALLHGYLRWQVVGHGRRDDRTKHEQTLGGSGARALASQIARLSQQLNDDYSINSQPGYISLVGCSLAERDATTSYAHQLALSLDRQGIRADIAARRTAVMVSQSGGKFTQDSQGYWQHKISEDKLLLRWNKQGKLLPATEADLALRLQRIKAIVDQLALGKITYPSLTQQQLAYLADAFQHADEGLDVKRLMQIVFDAEQRQAWYQEVYQLLQLQRIHPQLANLSSQAALQLSQDWRENQAKSIAELVMTAKENTVPGVSMTATIALQALYIENPAFNSLASETALGLAWLAACSQGAAKCKCFLSGLVTHTIINQQQAVSALPTPETAQINQLRTLFTELKQIALSNPKIFTRTLASSFNGTEGSYLLKVNHHVLMLASRIEQGQQHYYLYDPKVGQISCKGADPIANSRALNAVLKRYLQGKNSTLESIDIYKVNTGNAKNQIPTLARLESVLEDLHHAPPRSTMTAAVRIGKVRIAAQTLRQMGAMVGDEPLSFLHLNETNWVSRLYFDPMTLSHYLSTVKGSDIASHTAVQLLDTLTRSHKGTSLFTVRAAPAAIEVANELLGKISEHVEKGEIKPALWSSLRSVSAGHLARLEKFSQQGGRLMQGYGYTRGIQDLINYNRLLNRTDLTQEEKRDLRFERNFAIASLTSNFLIDGSQYGLAKLGGYLARTGPAPVIEVAQCGLRPFTPFLASRLGASRATVGLEMLGSRLGQISFNAGSKFARMGGSALGVLASGFDIYNAYRSFSQLAQTTDPAIRQDLMVNGSLSVLGAAVGIGVNIAFAIGGTAAVVAGPLGLALGAAIIASAQIYSAVRQIEAIKRHITLTTIESWENGWRLFLGENLTPEVQRRWTEQVEKPAIRQEYDRLLEKYADTVLKQASPLQRLGSYYYSRGDFHLEQHVKRELDLSALDLLQNATPYYLVLNGGFTYKDSVSFIPTQLYGINDFVDANAPLSSASTVRKAVLAHPPQEALADSEEMVALFDLGDGDDIAIGHRNKRNSFNINIGAGRKNYTGGRLSDIFYLDCTAMPANPSRLDGGSALATDSNAPFSPTKEHDTLVARGKPLAAYGYLIDLKRGEIRYRGITGLVAEVFNIEHVIGHRETHDVLIGNEDNNQLDGQGGEDKLFGLGGDDVLTLAAGTANGGTGIDTYCILQNSQEKDVEISLSDSELAGEVSNIMLSHHVDQIESIRIISGGDGDERYPVKVAIRLRNNNGTHTTLLLKDAYQRNNKNSKYLTLANRYLLSTRDGVLLLSGWPDSIAQDDEGNGSFSPIFNAQYSIAHDHRASSLNFFKAPQPADSPIRLAQNNGQGKITVAGATLSLPTFMQLVAEDTPFNDYLVGDNANNQLHSRRGNDQLQGKGGTDSYIIHLDENQGDTPRMIWIDNEDPHPNPQSDWLILPVAIEQISKISQVGNDIVLSHASPALGQFKIGLRNFMLDARYRHITVVDKRGGSYTLDVDEQGQAYLGQKQSEIQATERDDSILLSGAIILAEGSFHALAGDDTVFDSSECDRRLYGDAGNDILIASRSGRKTLEGGEGDDQLFSDVGNDILLGGTGNDQLMGGEGDDTYRYGQGDGDDLINDAGGHDTLLFDEGITHNDLRFKRAGNDLQITFLAKDTDRITVKHYFKSSAFQIEKIKMGRDEMRGDDIARLVQMIPSFPSSEREATSSVNPSLFTRDPNLAANPLSSH